MEIKTNDTVRFDGNLYKVVARRGRLFDLQLLGSDTVAVLHDVHLFFLEAAL